MPINRREFESGEPEPSLLVTGFLRSNPDYAYTMEELVSEVASREVDLTVEEVQSILGFLEAKGTVESKTVHGVAYYIYRKVIGFRRP